MKHWHTLAFTDITHWPMPQQSPLPMFPNCLFPSTMGLFSVRADKPSHQLERGEVEQERVNWSKRGVNWSLCKRG